MIAILNLLLPETKKFDERRIPYKWRDLLNSCHETVKSNVLLALAGAFNLYYCIFLLRSCLRRTFLEPLLLTTDMQNLNYSESSVLVYRTYGILKLANRLVFRLRGFMFDNCKINSA